jgi:hypothetical protein
LCSRRNIPKRLHTGSSDNKYRRLLVRHSSSPDGCGVPHPGTGTAPETGQPPARLSAARQQSSLRRFRPAVGPPCPEDSDQETPSKLHPGDSDNRRQATVGTAFTVPGPQMGAGSRTLARGRPGTRNRAVACPTYCRKTAVKSKEIPARIRATSRLLPGDSDGGILVGATGPRA